MRLRRHGQFHGHRLAADTHASDDDFLGAGVINADASEIDREILFQPANHYLEDAAQILALGDSPGNLVEQIHPLYLSPEFPFGNLAIRDVPRTAQETQRPPGLVSKNLTPAPYPANARILVADPALK